MGSAAQVALTVDQDPVGPVGPCAITKFTGELVVSDRLIDNLMLDITLPAGTSIITNSPNTFIQVKFPGMGPNNTTNIAVTTTNGGAITLPIPPAGSGPPGLNITEIFWDAPFSGQWVELVNNQNVPVDLCSSTLSFKDTAPGATDTFNGCPIIVQPGETVVITPNGQPDPSAGAADHHVTTTDGDIGNGLFVLGDGYSICLNGAPVSTLDYTFGECAAGESLQIDPISGAEFCGVPNPGEFCDINGISPGTRICYCFELQVGCAPVSEDFVIEATFDAPTCANGMEVPDVVGATAIANAFLPAQQLVFDATVVILDQCGEIGSTITADITIENLTAAEATCVDVVVDLEPGLSVGGMSSITNTIPSIPGNTPVTFQITADVIGCNQYGISATPNFSCPGPNGCADATACPQVGTVDVGFDATQPTIEIPQLEVTHTVITEPPACAADGVGQIEICVENIADVNLPCLIPGIAYGVVISNALGGFTFPAAPNGNLAFGDIAVGATVCMQFDVTFDGFECEPAVAPALCAGGPPIIGAGGASLITTTTFTNRCGLPFNGPSVVTPIPLDGLDEAIDGLQPSFIAELFVGADAHTSDTPADVCITDVCTPDVIEFRMRLTWTNMCDTIPVRIVEELPRIDDWDVTGGGLGDLPTAADIAAMGGLPGVTSSGAVSTTPQGGFIGATIDWSGITVNGDGTFELTWSMTRDCDCSVPAPGNKCTGEPLQNCMPCCVMYTGEIFNGRFEVIVPEGPNGFKQGCPTCNCFGCEVAGPETFTTQTVANASIENKDPNCGMPNDCDGACVKYLEVRQENLGKKKPCEKICFTSTFSVMDMCGEAGGFDWSTYMPCPMVQNTLTGYPVPGWDPADIVVDVGGTPVTVPALPAADGGFCLDFSSLENDPAFNVPGANYDITVDWCVSPGPTDTGTLGFGADLVDTECYALRVWYKFRVKVPDIDLFLTPIGISEPCAVTTAEVCIVADQDCILTNAVLDLDFIVGAGSQQSFAYTGGTVTVTDANGAPVAVTPVTTDNGTSVGVALGDLDLADGLCVYIPLRGSCALDPTEYQATLTWDTACPNPSSEQSGTVRFDPLTTVIFRPLIEIITDPPVELACATNFTYDAVVINNGSGGGYDLQIDTVLPPTICLDAAGFNALYGPGLMATTNATGGFISFVSPVAYPPGSPLGALEDRDGTGLFNDLPPGQLILLRIPVNIKSCLPDTFETTATLLCSGNPCDEIATDSKTFIPEPPTLITTALFPSDIAVCESTKVVFVVDNPKKPADYNVVMTQHLPEHITYCPGSVTFRLDPGDGTGFGAPIVGADPMVGPGSVAGGTDVTFDTNSVPGLAIIPSNGMAEVCFYIKTSCEAFNTYGPNQLVPIDMDSSYEDFCGNPFDNQTFSSAVQLRAPDIALNKIPDGRVVDIQTINTYTIRLRHRGTSTAAVPYLHLCDTLDLKADFCATDIEGIGPIADPNTMVSGPGGTYDGTIDPPTVTFTNGWLQMQHGDANGDGQWDPGEGTIAIDVTGILKACDDPVNCVNLYYGCLPDPEPHVCAPDDIVCFPPLRDCGTFDTSPEPDATGPGFRLNVTPCGGEKCITWTNVGATMTNISISDTSPVGFIYDTGANVTFAGEWAGSVPVTTVSTDGGYTMTLDIDALCAAGVFGTPPAIDTSNDSYANMTGASGNQTGNGPTVQKVEFNFQNAIEICVPLIPDPNPPAGFTSPFDCEGDPTDLDFSDPLGPTLFFPDEMTEICFFPLCPGPMICEQFNNNTPAEYPQPDVDLQPNSFIVTPGGVQNFCVTIENNAQVSEADNIVSITCLDAGWMPVTPGDVTSITQNITFGTPGTPAVTTYPGPNGTTCLKVDLTGAVLGPSDNVVICFDATSAPNPASTRVTTEMTTACGDPVSSVLIANNPCGDYPNTEGDGPFLYDAPGGGNETIYNIDQDRAFGIGLLQNKTVKYPDEPDSAFRTNLNARVGECLVYRLTWQMWGADFNNVVLSDTLPVGWILDAASPITIVSNENSQGVSVPLSFSAAGQTIMWSAGNLPQEFYTFVIDVPIKVANVSANNNCDYKFNEATVSFDVDGFDTPLPAVSNKVHVVEGFLNIMKMPDPCDVLEFGESVVYTVTVDMEAMSNTCVYDIVISDALPPSLVMTPFATDGLDNDGDGLTDEADEAGQLTGQSIAIDSSNNPQLAMWCPGDPPLVIQYEGELSGVVIPGVEITNTAMVIWDSLPDGYPNDSEERDGTDTGPNDYLTNDVKVITSIVEFAMSKELVGSSEPYTPLDLPTIGERLVYSIRIDLPSAGIMPRLQVIDDLPPGLDFAGCDPNGSLTFPGVGYSVVVPAGGPSFVGANASAPLPFDFAIGGGGGNPWPSYTDEDATPCNNLNADGNGDRIRWRFESVDANGVGGDYIENVQDNDPSNDYFEIFYEVIVKDIPANFDWETLTNAAQFRWGGDNGNPLDLFEPAETNITDSVDVMITEPKLTLDKSMEVMDDMVIITLVVSNDIGGSSAFDINILDDLMHLCFVPGSAMPINIPRDYSFIVNSPSPNNPAADQVQITTNSSQTFQDRELLPGDTISFVFKASITEDDEGPIMNTADITYSSIDGADPWERTSTTSDSAVLDFASYAVSKSVVSPNMTNMGAQVGVDQIVYEITVENTSTMPTNITVDSIVDTFDPAVLQYVSDTSGATAVPNNTAGTVTWTGFTTTLAQGATLTFQVTFDAIASTHPAYTINRIETEVSAPTGQLPSKGGEALAWTWAKGIAVFKSIADDECLCNGTENPGVFEITVVNTGTVWLTDIMIDDIQYPACDTTFASPFTLGPGSNVSYLCTTTLNPAFQTNEVVVTASPDWNNTPLPGPVNCPGLLAGKLGGNASFAANPGNLGVANGPDAYWADGGANDAARDAHWLGLGTGPGASTIVYTGDIYLPPGDTHFLLMSDDQNHLSIDGTSLISDTTWNSEDPGTFTNPNATGTWFSIDLRTSNGGGGYGLFGQAGWGGIASGFLMKHTPGNLVDQSDPDWFHPEDIFRFAKPGVDPADLPTDCVTVATNGISFGTDTNKPAFVFRPDPTDTYECIEDVPLATTNWVYVIDDCMNGLTVTVAVTTNDTTGCPTDPTLVSNVWTATDGCGNVCAYTQVVTVVDSTELKIVAPDDLELDCFPTSGLLAGQLPPPATDLTLFWMQGGKAIYGCSAGIVFAEELLVGDCGLRTVTRTYTLTNACYTDVSDIQTITYYLGNTPVITCPPDQDLGCLQSTNIFHGMQLAPAVADCPGTLVYTDVVTQAGCIYTATRTWTARGQCSSGAGDQEATCDVVYTFTVDEEEPKIVSVPPDQDLGCFDGPYDDASITAWIDGQAPVAADVAAVVTSDDCDNVTVSFDCNHIFTSNCGGELRRRIKAVDGCGNQVVDDVTYTFYKNLGTPVIQPLPDVDLGCIFTTNQIPQPITSLVKCETLFPPSGTEAPAAIVGNVPEAGDFALAYTLNLANGANYNASAIPYAVDNTGILSACTFSRVAYYFELGDGTWVYTSMDPFSSVVTELGLPSASSNPVLFQQIVNNMNVFASPGAPVTTGTGIATGNIEFWPSNYGNGNTIGIPNATGAFDFGDGGGSTGAGYGSFQVHNHGASETIFAYNSWGNGNAYDAGIGTNTGAGRPDYTFANNGNGMERLHVLILPDPKIDDCDPCGINSLSILTNRVIGTGCDGELERVYEITDSCGNSGTVTQTFTYVIDTVFPKITNMPPDTFLGCLVDDAAAMAVLPSIAADMAQVLASNECDVVTTHMGDIWSTNGCTVSIDRSFMVTDECNNIDIRATVYTYTATPAPPTLTGPATLDLGCIQGCAQLPAPNVGQFTAGSTCNVGPVTYVGESSISLAGGDLCGMAVERTYSVTDECDQTTTFVQTLLFSLDVTPSITAVEAGGDMGCQPCGTHPATNLTDLAFADFFDHICNEVPAPGLAYEYWNLGGNTLLADFFGGAGVTPAQAPDATGTVTANLFDDNALRTQGDLYMLRWTGFINITTPGTYFFDTESDDGSRLYINGNLIVDNDGFHGRQRRDGMATLGAGCHAVEIQFSEATGGDFVEVRWNGPDSGNTRQLIPDAAFVQNCCVGCVASCAEAAGLTADVWGSNAGANLGNFFGGAGNTPPNLVSTVAVPGLTQGDPSAFGPNGDDNFTVRWRGFIKVPACGDYTFYTTSDDGSMIYINGNLVVNNDGNHGNQTREGTVTLEKGCHAFELQFFESTGGQNIVSEWASADAGIGRQQIPDSVMFTECCPDSPADFTPEELMDCGFLSVTDVVSTNDASCQVIIDRTYRLDACCGNFAEASTSFTYTKIPSADAGVLADLDAGCIPSTNVIPHVEDYLINASSSCDVVTIDFLRTENVVDTQCVDSFDRVYIVETLCGVFATVTQTVSYVLESGPPRITGIIGFEDFGCIAPGIVPRSVQEELDSITSVDDVAVISTNLLSEFFSTNDCEITVARTYRVEDCCGNFHQLATSFSYTPIPNAPVVSTLPADINAGCITALGQIPPIDLTTVAIDADCPIIDIRFNGEQNQADGFCESSFERVYTVETLCDVTTTFTQNVTYCLDTAPPEFVALPGYTNYGCVAADPRTLADELAAIVATDDKTVVITQLIMEVRSVQDCEILVERTWRVEDCCGKFDTKQSSYAYTLSPTNLVVTAPAGQDLGCIPDLGQIPAPNLSGVGANSAGVSETSCQTAVVTAVADAFIRGNTVPSGFGQFLSNIVWSENGVQDTKTYMKFDVSTLPILPSITTPSLKFTVDMVPTNVPGISGFPATIDVYGLNDGDPGEGWGESTIDWASAPQNDPTLGAGVLGGTTLVGSVPVDVGANGAITVTGPALAAFLNADTDGSVTFILVAGNPTSWEMFVAARESATPPALCYESCVDSPADAACPAATVTHESDTVVATTNCTDYLDRVFRVTDLCGLSVITTQRITYAYNAQAPQIAAVSPFVDYGCVDLEPRPLADSSNAIVVVDDNTALLTTQLVNEVRLTNNCQVTVTRTWRVEDCCGAFGTADETYRYTIRPSGATVAALADLSLGCIPDLGQIPLPNTTLVQALSDCSIVSITHLQDGPVGAISACADSFERVYLVEDLCGATTPVTQLVSYVYDSQNPTFDAVAPFQDYGCVTGEPRPVNVSSNALVASDDHTLLTFSLVNEVRLTNNCQVTVTRSWRVEDCCGKFDLADETYQFTIQPSSATVAVLGPLDLGCINNIGQVPQPNTTLVSAQSDCSIVAITHLRDDPSDGGYCTETFGRVYQIEDLCANLLTVTQQISFILNEMDPMILDTEAPIDFGCQDVRSWSLPLPDAAATNAVVAMDANLVSTQWVGDVHVTNGCDVTVTRTWRVEDCCGKKADATVTFTYVVQPESAPVISGQNLLPLGCITSAGLIPLPSTSSLTVQSDCADWTAAHLEDRPATTSGCLTSFERVYIATDRCGQSSTWTQTISYTEDAQDPVFVSIPADDDFGCQINDPIPPVFTNIIVGADDTLVLSTTLVSRVRSTNNCVVTEVRTWELADCCGNTTEQTVTYQYTPQSTAGPSITAPAQLDLGCIASASQVSPPSPATATASADCGIATITWLGDSAPVTAGCITTIIRTYQATDNCNVSNIDTQVITYTVDALPPVFTSLPADEDFGCVDTDPVTTDTTLDVAATDESQVIRLGMVSETRTTNDCNVTVVRTFEAEDCCGRITSGQTTYTFTWRIAPAVIAGNATLDLGCIPSAGLIPGPSITPLNASSGCPIQSFDFLQDNAPTTAGCLTSFDRLYQVLDNCGQPTVFTQVVSYTVDLNNPTIDVPAGQDFGCVDNDPVPVPDTNAVTTTDDSVVIRTEMVDEARTTNGCDVTVVRTWEAEDCCGKIVSDSATFTFTWRLPPALITGQANIDLGCIASTAAIPMPNTTPLSATSGCSIDNFDHLSDAAATQNGCVWSFERSYEVIDNCGQQSVFVQTYTYVLDAQSPVISSVPAGQDFGCQPATFVMPAPDAAATGTVVAVDDLITRVEWAGDTYATNVCGVTITRIWEAEDCCGNLVQETAVSTFTVLDAPPTVDALPVLDLGCINDLGQVPQANTAAVSAQSGCPLAGITHTGDTPTSNDPCASALDRVYTVTDNCGQTVSVTQRVTWTIDTELPKVTSTQSGGNLGCAPVTIPAVDLSQVTATDNCGVDTIVWHCDITNVLDCVTTITRIYRVTDNCGNQVDSSVLYTYTTDDTSPQIGLPFGFQADLDLGCNPLFNALPPVDPSQFSVADDCGTVTVIHESDSFGSNGCAGVLTRVYSATDSCGNRSEVVQNIAFIVDVERPTPGIVPADLDIGCDPASIPGPNAAVFGVTGMCSTLAETNVFEETTTSAGCQFTMLRTYELIDECGNRSTADQTITWTESETPTISCPPDVMLPCNATPPAPNPALASATGCGISAVTHAGDLPGPGMVFRVFEATDNCGNTISCTQTYSFASDGSDPVITSVPQGGDLGCNPTSLPVALPADITATDDSGMASTSVVLVATNMDGCVGELVHRYRVVDACGNDAEVQVNYTFTIDTTPPEITCPASQFQVQVNEFCETFYPAIFPITTDDGCGGDIQVFQDPPAGALIMGPGVYPTTVFAVDACGNTNSCTVPVLVEGDCLHSGIPGKIPNVGIELTKTVYAGHTDGAGCATAGELVDSTIGAAVTYCFTIENTGDTGLDLIFLEDRDLIPAVLRDVTNFLGMGETVMVFEETFIDNNLTNTASVIAFPSIGGPQVSDTDTAVVLGGDPSIDIQKTVLRGHNAACPGVELVDGYAGDPVTYCFLVTNTGDVDLRNVRVTDAQIGANIDVGTLTVGQSASVSHNGEIIGPVNTAGVSGEASSGIVVSDTDDAHARLGCGCVAGAVFNDLNNDGLVAGENLANVGIAGVLVRITRTDTGTDIPIGTVNTGADGTYQFNDLVSGTYRVEIDPATVPELLRDSLANALPVTVERGICECNVDLDGTSFAGVPAPTAIELESLQVTPTAEGNLVAWTTSWEDGVLGYNLLDADGQQLNEGLILASGGGAYQFLDAGAQTGSYELQEVTNDLGLESHGSVEVLDAAPSGEPTQVVTAEDNRAAFTAVEGIATYLVFEFEEAPVARSGTTAFRGQLLEVDGKFGLYLSVEPGTDVVVE